MKGVRAPYSASAANWMHRSHSLAGSQPDHSTHLRSTGCTSSIHSPAVNWTCLHFSGQPYAQAAFTHLPPTGPLCASPPTGYPGIHLAAANRTTPLEWDQ